jgi:bacterioferritin-associated ferredoxin
VPLRQRAFIETAVAEVRDAKQLALPLLMVDGTETPWTARALRGLWERRGELDPLLQRATLLLRDFELPFLEEEERLARAGTTLAADMAAFEVAMVDFERAFWEARHAEHEADPGRWALEARAESDVCALHRLDSATVRRAIALHGATTFAEIAPHLGTDPTCSTCHVGVTRLLVQAVRLEKGRTDAPPAGTA